MDLVIKLVRQSILPEKKLAEWTPPVDHGFLRERCERLKDAIYEMIPDAEEDTALDAQVYRRCKKAIIAFKTETLAMAKTLADSALWADVIRYCNEASVVNENTPLWTDSANNKGRTTIQNRLQMLATRASAALVKGKGCAMPPGECAALAELCKERFPEAARMLSAWMQTHGEQSLFVGQRANSKSRTKSQPPNRAT